MVARLRDRSIVRKFTVLLCSNALIAEASTIQTLDYVGLTLKNDLNSLHVICVV